MPDTSKTFKVFETPKVFL